MKICLVSAFPPSRRGLNEYGFHIARELQQDPLLSLTVLADQLEAPQLELSDFNVHFRAHGIFSARPEYPDFSLRGNPEHRILAFGKWGTYKRLETLLESFANILEKLPNTNLVIAGSDHPATPGYVESIAKRFHDCPRIEFRGAVVFRPGGLRAPVGSGRRCPGGKLGCKAHSHCRRR